MPQLAGTLKVKIQPVVKNIEGGSSLMNEWIDVEVVNWNKYNPRSDIKRSSWFRFEHTAIDDSDFFNFSHEEWRAWTYILSMACRKNSCTVRLNYDHAERCARISRQGLDGAIEKLKQLQIVHVHVTSTSRARYAHDTSTNATDVRTDVTNERTNESSQKETKENRSSLSEAQRQCEETWKETLKHFKCERNLLPTEPVLIARGIQRWGPEAVMLALIGVRHEPASEGYDPAKNVFLARVLPQDPRDEGKFQRLFNLGVQAQAKSQKRIEEKAAKQDEEEWPDADPDRVREILKGAGF